MLVEKDWSELSDEEKSRLVDAALMDYAQTLAFTGKTFLDRGDSISKGVARQLVGKEEEVLRLRTWVGDIIKIHITRRQVVESQPPSENPQHLLQQAKIALTELKSRAERAGEKTGFQLQNLCRFVDGILAMVETLDALMKGQPLVIDGKPS